MQLKVVSRIAWMISTYFLVLVQSASTSFRVVMLGVVKFIVCFAYSILHLEESNYCIGKCYSVLELLRVAQFARYSLKRCSCSIISIVTSAVFYIRYIR